MDDFACEKCIHNEVCDQSSRLIWARLSSEKRCTDFGDRTKYVEAVPGRWKYYHKKNIAVCTNCSFERDLDANFGKAISCPNCGAKMDGDVNA